MQFDLIPCSKFKDSDKEMQMSKIWSEMLEAWEALRKYNYPHTNEEIVDMMIAGSTYLKYHSGLSDDGIQALVTEVNKKNRNRGYHEG